MQNESQLSKEILDCFVVVNTDQMGNARYDVDFNKLSKEFATARAEGAAEERERCVKIIRSHLLTDWSGETEVYEQIEQIAKKCEALTTKEHHVS